MEALEKEQRVDDYLREIAKSKWTWNLPAAPQARHDVFEAAFRLGVKVLSVTRVALAKFVSVPESARAAPFQDDLALTQDRCCFFMREYQTIGAEALKAEGARLVRTHLIPTTHVQGFLGIAPEEILWTQGLVAEYDAPKNYTSKKEFIKVVRDIIAEWNDVDSLASHYAYGLDVFCTLDDGKGAGAGAILHLQNRPLLHSRYGIRIGSSISALNPREPGTAHLRLPSSFPGIETA